MSVLKKLFQIQQMNLSVKKDGKNPHFKNQYITLDKLVSVLQPICNDKELLITHFTENSEVITAVVDINDASEKYISKFPLGDTSNPQKVGSAITYAKRYNLCQIFNIITDRDDDGNKASSKPPFDMDSFRKLKGVANKFKTAKDAIIAIEKKYILNSNYKEKISLIYENPDALQNALLGNGK